MGKNGFAVGGKRKYPGDGWAKKDKRGRWVPVTRESTVWSKPAKHNAGGGCLTVLVVMLASAPLAVLVVGVLVHVF